MQLPHRRQARALGVVLAAGALVVLSAPAALAIPAPVTGLAVAGLAPHGVQLTWTASGTGTPVVRDVTNLQQADYGTGRLVPPGGTTDCPAASCALDTGFTNTVTQRYAVWATDADGTVADPAVLDVAPLAPVPTATVLDAAPATAAGGRLLTLTGSVTRGGAPFAGAVVQLRGTVLGSTGEAILGTTTAAADGTLRMSLLPTRSRSYWFAFPASSWSASSTSAAQTVRLVPRVVAVVSPPVVPWRRPADVRGTVTPNLRGARVAIQRWTPKGWATVGTRALSATSTWSFPVTPPVGRYRYRAVLLGDVSFARVVSPEVQLFVGPRPLYAGLSGPDVLSVERRLTALHYDVGRIDGRFDQDLRHAVITFQKVEGLPRTGRWDIAERIRGLRPRGFTTRYRVPGLSVEVDITRQVLALSRDGVLQRLIDVSTGSERVYYQEGVGRQVAHTPRGAFRIYKKIDGLRVSPLGELWRPSYFTGGFAIHGNGSVPTVAASHGCVRITNAEANRLFTTLAVGTRVYVYDA
jgi:peptidoglycan hydrolase-like protein with peptidoglycan-binding domain